MEDVTTYKKWLEALGVDVLAYKEFGDYQGTWLAKVRYMGEIFWIEDYYGSCSWCDTLQSMKNDCYDHGYTPEPSCLDCQKWWLKMEDYAIVHWLSLDMRNTWEEIYANHSKGISWDHEAETICNFLLANKE